MKTVDMPFAFNTGFPDAKTIDKSDQLREAMDKVLKKADTEKVKSSKVRIVYDGAAFSKYANEYFKEREGKEWMIQAEKLVGKSGFMVVLEEKGREGMSLLIRMKDGKAFVAGVAR